MISTRLQDGALLFLYHCIQGLVDAEAVRTGLVDAHEVVKAAVYEFDAMPLVLDLRGAAFADLQAHRLWKEGLYGDEFILKHIKQVAVLGPDTPAFRAELTGLSNEETRFFLNLEEARAWIRSLK